jgi:hypothetical protein
MEKIHIDIITNDEITIDLVKNVKRIEEFLLIVE